MTSNRLMQIFIIGFILVFFAYLFGPLILMSITAFNSSPFPRVAPWECFSTEWFDKLARDERLMEGLWNSLVIGFFVVLLSVPLGLAGAIMLTQVHRNIRSIFYTIVISPILVPGVVLGISTLIFWDRLGTMFDAGYKSVFYDGMFLTVIGQSTFISAYCMLVFIARLQRFEPVQEEAALDLGATHAQAFRKVLLPFLKPAVGSAAVLAFLASFENYNTTVFTVISDSTLTTVLASKVRYGIDPSISSLAVIIVALTLIGAVVFEVLKQREQHVAKARMAEGLGKPQTRMSRAEFFANPATVLVILVTIVGVGMVTLITTYDTVGCKLSVQQQKRELQKQLAPTAPAPAPTAPADGTTPETAPATREDKPFQGIFDPDNLQGGDEKKEEEREKPFQGIFDPNNLQGGDETKDEEREKPFQGIFDPDNLQGGDEQKEDTRDKPYEGTFDPNNLQPQDDGETKQNSD